MNYLKFSTRENGFTLIESIIAVILVTLTISGLFLAWYMMETRDRSLEQYWQYKETVELAYQITHQTVRTNAKFATISTINSGEGLSFTGTDNLMWTFTKDGSNYKLVHDGKEEILISNICNKSVFGLNGTEVNITLGVMTPVNWTGLNDLTIDGQVYLRNP